jgi:hypothetical protein
VAIVVALAREKDEVKVSEALEVIEAIPYLLL